MKVWLITIGEPVPLPDKGDVRLFRTGLIAQFLSKRHHEIIWWTSTFDHFKKIHLFNIDTAYKIRPEFYINFIHGKGYKKNISLDRIIDHLRIAKKFKILSQKFPKPEIILCSFPPIKLAKEAVDYGKRNNLPVIVDIRDMWPEAIISSLTKKYYRLLNIIAHKIYKEENFIFENATALTGITEEFVDWGIKKSKRQRSCWDRAFYMGYEERQIEESRQRKAEKFWDELGVNKDMKKVVCFIGTIGRQIDIETIIQAAYEIQKLKLKKEIQFVFCGAGDFLDYYKKRASGIKNVIFSGWVDYPEIKILMQRSFVGLNPLPDRIDFISTINNKAIEYISEGLPIICSPEKGVLSEFIKKYECGISYKTGDVESLVKAILKLSEDDLLCQRLSNNSRSVYEKKFRAEKIYNDMIDYLEEILNEKNASSKK